MGKHPSIADIRKTYQKQSLSEADVDANPLSQFEKWWLEATSSHVDEVNAMVLATSDKNGRPSARTVLLKGISDEGFIFFTNYNSRKAAEIHENPRAALVFFWKELERQVRIEGIIKKVSEADSEAYFRSRPPESQIGAWVSPQSSVIPSRSFLEDEQHRFEEKFSDGDIPKPPFWGGYVVIPESVEFWQGRPGRLHDRLLYTRKETEWMIGRLAP